MKVSKVDHVKSGIDQKQSGQCGMLYKQPQKKYAGNRLEEHVRSLNKKAMFLYKVFPDQVNKAQNKKEQEKELEEVNSLMKNILSQFDYGKTVADIEKTIDSISVSYHISDDHIQSLVDQYLKKSLRKYIRINDERIYIPDVIKEFLKAKISFDTEQKMIDSSRTKILLDVLKEDYLKENQIKKIAYSIENNSVPVRVMEKSNQKRLVLASAENPKKAYIFDFLKEYAQATKQEQSELLRHMRYLILLYYYDQDEIKEEEITEWSFGSVVMENERLFSEEVNLLIQDREYVKQQIKEENQTNKNKAKYRMLGDKIKESLNESIVCHYQKACQAVSEKDVPWIKYISDHTSSVFNRTGQIDPSKLSLSYLCKNTWNTWMSFIAMKYIDMGKGVFHFAMSDMDKVGNQDHVVMGKLNPEFADGISSFDYERIKSEDDLHRKMSSYIAFAVYNFSRAIWSDNIQKKKKQEDILTANWKDITFNEDIKKKLLQYFGGASIWEGSDSLMEIIGVEELATCIKENLYIARNVNFHFAGSEKGKKEKDEILKVIVDKESKDVGKYYRKVFYSNNVTTFYSDEYIVKLMNHLYQKEKNYQAQIPSYNKVISKTYLPNLIYLLLKGKNRVKISDPDVMKVFNGTFYFILKEIYYNNFLQEPKLKDMFCEGLKKAPRDKKSDKPYENFMQRFHELEKTGMDFGEICQQIMVDYEQQNQEKKKRATAVAPNRKNDPPKVFNHDTQKYKHFRTLLYIGLREAFITYLKDEKNKEWYGPLREPQIKEQPKEENFVNEWKLDVYSEWAEFILKDNLAGAWYVVAHFINQAQLNHLIGDIKNYIQFIRDIDRRAKSTGNRVSEDTEEQVERYKKILRVLEFAKFFCGQTTNYLEDYYKDENDFADHIGHYVNFQKMQKKGTEAAHALQAFCNSECKAGKAKKKIGIYYDGMNPIVNRNITLASMYGNEKLLEKTMRPVEEQDIRKYYSLMAELDVLFKKGGVCETAEEQKRLRQFQNLKNRIELVDVLNISELVNDFMAQLIGWAYIRERDMMYFQLGFYYIKLYFTDTIPADSFLRTLELEKGSIADGAVLYQIASMYSFDFPIYVKKGESSVACATKANSIAQKFGIFEGKYCNGDKRIIENGLCFFENINLHGNLSEFRDYLVHFKYFAHLDQSILELYSKASDSFFSYNIKMKKSVSYVLTNILLSYFINAKLSFSSYGSEKYIPENKITVERKSSNISIESAQTDYFTYKLQRIVKNKNGVDSVAGNKNDVIQVEARDEVFVDEVIKTINYKAGR